MKISLILLNYNDYKTTIKYINFVKEYKEISNVIVVDNCSTNDSYNQLKIYESRKIHVIKSDRNGGYAYGNNFGVNYAKKNFNPEYIIISNPDVFFKEEIISPIIEFMKYNKNIAIAAPKIINNEHSNEAIAWKLPTYWMNICKLSIVLNKIFYSKMHYKEEHFKDKNSYVDVIPGSFFIVNTDIFYDVNMFDEGTFLYGEENILAYKIKKKGYKSVIMNEYYFNHEHSATINKAFSSYNQKYNILFSSLDYYNKKYLKTNRIKNAFFKISFYVLKVEKVLFGFIKN